MGSRKPWSEEDNKEFIKMYLDGVPYKEMCSYFERNLLSVRSHVYDLNLKGKKRKILWQDWEIELLMKMKKEEKSWKEISYELDRPAGGCEKKYRDLTKEKEKNKTKKEKNVGERLTLKDDRTFEIKKIYHKNRIFFLCERVGIGYKEMFMECQI